MKMAATTLQQLRDILRLDQLPIVEDPILRTKVMRQFLPTAGQKPDTPSLTAIGGGPGAGKSYFYDLLSAQGKLPLNAALHDPDLVMLSLPGYQADAVTDPVLAFKRWEAPALQLANDILLEALMARHHIVYLRSFALVDSMAFVRQARELGYHISTHVMTCSDETAFARVSTREKETRRHVPRETTLERHATVRQHLPHIREMSDCYFLYENNTNDRHPTLIESSSLES